MAFLFGKKYIPDPQQRRSGLLPTEQTRAMIGNLALLRQIDAILQMEGVSGTPPQLEITDVKPVIDIGRFAITNPPALNFVLPDSESIAGLSDFRFILLGPGAGTFFDPRDVLRAFRLLTADLTINFGAVPTDNQRLSVRWNLFSIIGGTPFDIQVDGSDPLCPFLLDADITTLRFCFGGQSSGTDGSVGGVPNSNANHKWRGWLLPPPHPNIAPADEDGLGLSVTVSYRSVTGAGPDPTFPVGSTASVQALFQNIEASRLPVEL